MTKARHRATLTLQPPKPPPLSSRCLLHTPPVGPSGRRCFAIQTKLLPLPAVKGLFADVVPDTHVVDFHSPCASRRVLTIFSSLNWRLFVMFCSPVLGVSTIFMNCPNFGVRSGAQDDPAPSARSSGVECSQQRSGRRFMRGFRASVAMGSRLSRWAWNPGRRSFLACPGLAYESPSGLCNGLQ